MRNERSSSSIWWRSKGIDNWLVGQLVSCIRAILKRGRGVRLRASCNSADPKLMAKLMNIQLYGLERTKRKGGKKNTAQTHRERQRETERERRHSADWITRNGCPLVGSESLSIRFVDWRVGREDFPIVANLRRRFQPSAVCVRLSVCVFSPHLPNQPVVAYPCFF